MKRVYLLYGAIVAMSICDLFFIRRSTEGIQLGVMVALFLFYLVCLVMLFFKKDATLRWKFMMAAVALFTISIYFKTHEVRSKAAFRIAFAMHRQDYTNLAKLMNHKSDSLVKVMHAGGAEKIWATEIMDALEKDNDVKALEAQTGVRSIWMLEMMNGDKEIDGKFVPEFTLVHSGNLYGIMYNPTNNQVGNSPTAGYRTITRHDAEWQFWEANGGGFGGFM